MPLRPCACRSCFVQSFKFRVYSKLPPFNSMPSRALQAVARGALCCCFRVRTNSFTCAWTVDDGSTHGSTHVTVRRTSVFVYHVSVLWALSVLASLYTADVSERHRETLIETLTPTLALNRFWAISSTTCSIRRGMLRWALETL